MKFIINTAQPFRGYAQSILYRSEQFGGREVVAYSDGKSWQQYKLEKEEKGLTLKLVSQEEYDAMCAEYFESQKTPLQEVTREQYWYALEVLPPCRFDTYAGCQGFHVSEHITGDLVDWYFQVGDKYYHAVQSDSISREDIGALLDKLKR